MLVQLVHFEKCHSLLRSWLSPTGTVLLIHSNSRANSTCLSRKALPVNGQTQLHFLPQAHRTFFHPLPSQSPSNFPCSVRGHRLKEKAAPLVIVRFSHLSFISPPPQVIPGPRTLTSNRTRLTCSQ
jgi:hypothetical protein